MRRAAPESRGWMGLHLLHARQGGAGRGDLEDDPRPAVAQCVQDLRAGHGRPAGRHGQRARALVSEVCKKSVQAMAADMQGGIRREFFEKYSIAELRGVHAAGDGDAPAGSWSRCTPRRGTRTTGRSRGTRRWACVADRLAARRRRMRPSSTSAADRRNEAGFLLQLFARLYGTNNVNNCSYYCHQASRRGAGQRDRHAAPPRVTLEDVERMRPAVPASGAQPGVEPPALMRTMLRLRRRGGQVIVINPLRERGLVQLQGPVRRVEPAVRQRRSRTSTCSRTSAATSRSLPGVAKAVLERGAEDRGVPRRAHGGGSTRSEALVRGACVGRDRGVARASPREQIERWRTMYARSQAHACSAGRWASPTTSTAWSNVQMIANLALLRGMLGPAGRGTAAAARPQQRAGDRLDGRRRRASRRRCSKRIEERLRRGAAARRAGWTRWRCDGAAPTRAASRWRCAWAATSTDRTRTRASPRGRCRQIGTIGVPEHHAEHGPRARHAGARRSSCRCWRATRSRRRPRRSRCSTTCA